MTESKPSSLHVTSIISHSKIADFRQPVVIPVQWKMKSLAPKMSRSLHLQDQNLPEILSSEENAQN
jgi:hypothetical protein